MTVRVAINGFGRIGRAIARIAAQRTDIDIVAINDLTDIGTLAHLLEFDSTHGRFEGGVRVADGTIQFGRHKAVVQAIPKPTELGWGTLGVDVVLECTGRFTKRDEAAQHLTAGARKVIVSAPAKGVDKTIVLGVNHATLDNAKDAIISCGSCTTNCLAPVAMVLHELLGIKSGLMTTIHAYTSDQRLLDAPHSDERRARSAALSMVPTSTGAAAAIGEVLPALKGRLDGMAVRVPTPNVSLVDLTFIAGRETSAEEINQAIAAAAAGPLKGILGYEPRPLVSIDFNGNPHSSIFDPELTKVLDGTMVKVLSWYDNEWGFSNRMVDLAVLFGS